MSRDFGLGKRSLPATMGLAATLAVASACQLIGGSGIVGPNATRRAQDVLANWDKVAGNAPADAVVLVDGMTAGGGWNTDTGKISFMNGSIEAATPLPTETPPQGLVTWPDGTKQAADLISAAAALRGAQSELRAQAGDDKCDKCQPLMVTGAQLSTRARQTARGPVMVPVWQFTFAQADAPIDPVTFPAVRDVVSVPRNSSFAEGGRGLIDIENAYGNPQSSTVTVAFTGAPYAGDKGCGADYTAQAVESDRAVAIIVNESHRVSNIGVACTAVGATRTATADLSQPLGNRVVLCLQFGTPVELSSDQPPADGVSD